MSASQAISVKEHNELKVYRGEYLAGMLRRTTKGCEFNFDPSYLENENFNGLSYKMQKKEKPYVFFGVNLPPFFAGLLPEGLRLKAIVKKLKTSEDDLFSILTAIGERCVGDVYVKDGVTQKAEFEVIDLKDIDFYELFQRNLDSELLQMSDDALAGVQEKISASMISFPVRFAKKHKSYILKLNPADKPKLVQNEHICLQIAKKCGLEVNATSIVQDKNSNAGLLVERFDRLPGDTNIEQRMIHQEDACQFLDRYPADKYRLSFKEVCEGVAEYTTAPVIELQKVIKLYAFSYLVGNGDLHAKNISLQTHPKTGRVHLSPVYDVICTYIYNDRKMALKVDGRDDNIKREHFIQFAKRFGVKEKATEMMLDKLLAKFGQNWQMLLSVMSEKEQNLYSAMVNKRIADLQN